jgi:hypothetical protein
MPEPREHVSKEATNMDENIRALTNKLAQLERDSGIERRLAALETYTKIALIVGVIFGATGAWGASALARAYTELNSLSAEITNVKNGGKLEEIRRVAGEELKGLDKAAVAAVNREAARLSAIPKGAMVVWPSDTAPPPTWQVCKYASGNESRILQIAATPKGEAAKDTVPLGVSDWTSKGQFVVESKTHGPRTFAPIQTLSVVLLCQE